MLVWLFFDLDFLLIIFDYRYVSITGLLYYAASGSFIKHV